MLLLLGSTLQMHFANLVVSKFLTDPMYFSMQPTLPTEFYKSLTEFQNLSFFKTKEKTHCLKIRQNISI